MTKYQRYSIRLRSKRNNLLDEYLIKEWCLYDAKHDEVLAVCMNQDKAKKVLKLINKGEKHECNV